ncbi:MFS transporter [Streptomyces justiciae]|uniref:MFS transporter n=1 Tax=Streptomyces justiciae TaxID=2780140 RepID=UPI0018821E4C|nr:MFS transporter [Streptomyces justiciae]MBE8471381.1 MFS transporter [Streptomyces justiciae]MCW8377165.1 MFS transporter [Streptomyces justiciae]
MSKPNVRALLLVLSAAAFLLTLAGSALKNTVQVYFVPMADTFGGSRGALAWATTLFAVTVAVASPLVGAIADRIGGAATLAVGTALSGAALVGCALAGRLWLFVAVYAVVAALASTMLSYVPLGVLVDELFRDGRKGLMYALLTNGAAVGFVVLVPLWSWLGTWASWENVLLVVGLVFLFVLAPVALLVARASGKVTSADAEAAVPDESPVRLSFAERFRLTTRNADLRRLALAMFACGATMAFIDVHFIPLMHDHGLGHTVSSTAVALLGVFEIAGGLLAGWLCDRGRIKAVLLSAYAVRGVAMLLVALTPTGTVAIAFGIVFGISYLATVIATTMWAARVLPVEVRGFGMGLVWTVHALGTALTSEVGALMADSTHSYTPVTLGCAALAAAACVLVLASRVPPTDTTAAPEAPLEEKELAPAAG